MQLLNGESQKWKVKSKKGFHAKGAIARMQYPVTRDSFLKSQKRKIKSKKGFHAKRQGGKGRNSELPATDYSNQRSQNSNRILIMATSNCYFSMLQFKFPLNYKFRYPVTSNWPIKPESSNHQHSLIYHSGLIPKLTQKLNPHQFQLFPIEITVGQFFLCDL